MYVFMYMAFFVFFPTKKRETVMISRRFHLIFLSSYDQYLIGK